MLLLGPIDHSLYFAKFRKCTRQSARHLALFGKPDAPAGCVDIAKCRDNTIYGIHRYGAGTIFRL